MNEREKVFASLALLPDTTWVLLLMELREKNHMLGMDVVDDPGPNAALEAVIDAELVRLGVNVEGLWK